MRVAFRSFSWLVATTLAAAVPSSAQRLIEVTPFVGAYLPGAGTDFRMTNGICCTDVQTATGIIVGQDNAVAGGARLTAWFGNQVAAEVNLAFSPSATVTSTYACSAAIGLPLNASNCAVPVADGSGRVVMGSARVLVTLEPPRLHTPTPYVVAGFALFHRGGPAVQAAELAAGTTLENTSWGPLVGIGFRMPVTYSLAPRVELVVDQRRWTGSENDVVLSLGLSRALWSARAPRSAAVQQEP